nr:vitamin K epoxide reductase family protein [uncultured Desulfobulbus sp.]
MIKRKNTVLQVAQFLALVASLLIAAQIGFSLYQGAPLCLNDGCKVVERLTRVSPLVFNGAGLLFFQIVYWGIAAARGSKRRVPVFINNILLAGLAAEGVLVSFQYLIAQTFCTYCIGIFCFIVLLNLLLGARQLVAGVLIFAAASLSFASLELHQPSSNQASFSDGVLAERPGSLTTPTYHLYFSSTCPHCEKVIEALKTNARISVAFHPVDEAVRKVDLPQLRYRKNHSVAANKGLLSALGIKEIPVLMAETETGLMILKGESQIFSYLQSLVPTAVQPLSPLSGMSGVSSTGTNSLIPGVKDDSCGVSEDCTEPAGGESVMP